jgi:cellulose synthase/poly-beta-1,6-N-acetylglucosamine synthase-like glycosyltransferase
MSFNRYQFAKRKLALVIAAHNEEMVLADTIASAKAAGQHPADIYVVNDSSTDATQEIAVRLLGEANVLEVTRSGKAKAVMQAIAHFRIVDRYYWMHIADADGVFTVTYFRELKSRLNLSYVAATGYIQSLKGGWISKYRLYEYTVGLEIMRRIQAFLGVIPVIPGPTSIYRTDVLNKLDFMGDTLTEDMDITFQIHRQKLGKIAFIPEAKTYTQDPRDFSDYLKQITRWYRGNFQVMQRHKIGRRMQRLDAYVSYVMLEQGILIAQLIAYPFMAWWSQSYGPLALMFITDFIVFLGFTIWAASINKRPDVIEAFPLFYVLRMVNLFVFMKAWYEIVVRRKFQSAAPGWDVAGRRYRITADAIGN